MIGITSPSASRQDGIAGLSGTEVAEGAGGLRAGEATGTGVASGLVVEAPGCLARARFDGSSDSGAALRLGAMRPGGGTGGLAANQGGGVPSQGWSDKVQGRVKNEELHGHAALHD